jgi:DNA-binding CsgD family transcriptional regulator
VSGARGYEEILMKMKRQYDEKTISALEEKAGFYEYVFHNVIAGVRYCISGKVVWNNEFDKERFGVKPGDAAGYIDETWLKNNIIDCDISQIREKAVFLNKQEDAYRVFFTKEKDTDGQWRNVCVSQKRIKHGDNPIDISITIDASDKLADFTKLESIWIENARLKNQIKIASLTTREKDVLILIAKGMSTKQIAESLFLSFHTVETHRKHLMKKTNSHNHNQLVHIAISCGMLEQKTHAYEGDNKQN